MDIRQQLDKVLEEIQHYLMGQFGPDNGRIAYEQIVKIVKKEFPKERVPDPELIKEYDNNILHVYEVAQLEGGWFAMANVFKAIFRQDLPNLITSFANRHDLLVDEMLKTINKFAYGAEVFLHGDYRKLIQHGYRSNITWTADRDRAIMKINEASNYVDIMLRSLDKNFEQIAHNINEYLLQNHDNFRAFLVNRFKKSGDVYFAFCQETTLRGAFTSLIGNAVKENLENKIAAFILITSITEGIKYCYGENPQ